jgi:cytochrome c
MYMLEYGSVYGADNEDARLVKIAYNRGNRPPVARASVTDSLAQAALSQRVFITSELRTLPTQKEAAGQAPLRVSFSSRGTNDPDDDDQLRYEWYFEGADVATTQANPVHTFKDPGNFKVVLKVSDREGLSNTDTLSISVGNSPPRVDLVSEQNKSFFWEGTPFRYSLRVTDLEDTTIDTSRAAVEYVYDPAPATFSQEPGSGEAAARAVPYGYALIERNDCKACHVVEGKSVGPSYKQVALRYKGQEGALAQLTGKVIGGGGGNWGESLMSAHPQIAPADVEEMVKYILSLSDKQEGSTKLDLSGTLFFDRHKKDEERGVYTVAGSYTDSGANGIAPITGHDVLHFRKARVPTVFMDKYVGFERFGNSLTNAGHKAFYMLKNTDLSGITGFRYEYAAGEQPGAIEVRLDSQAGPVVLKTPYDTTGGWDIVKTLDAMLTEPIKGRHDIYFIPVRPEKPNEDIINLKAVTFMK